MISCRTGVVLVLLSALAASPTEGYSKKQVKALVEEFNQVPRSTRPEHLLLPVNFVEHKEQSYAYYLPRRFARLAQEQEAFVIDDVKYKKTHVILRLESKRGAKLRLTIYDNRRLTQDFLDVIVPGVLSEVFDFGSAPEGSRYVANADSRMVHLSGCNHLPEREKRVGFTDLSSAEQDGYRRCPICFATEVVLPIEGYGPLRLEATEAARLFELAFPPVDDLETQSMIQELGESILENFPVETKGFDYVFKVLHSEIPHAVSFPTGFVYVTDKLLEAVEDPMELQLVLAHEIAHCEFHRRVPYEPVTGTESAFVHLQRQKQFREVEADLFAILCLTLNRDAASVLDRAQTILRKLQFASEGVPIEDGELSSHPPYSTRLAFLDPDLFHLAGSPMAFCGLGEDGEVLARVQLIGRRDLRTSGPSGANFTSSTNWEYYFFVELTDLVNEPVEKASGKLEDEGGHTVLLSSQRLYYRLDAGQAGIIVMGSRSTKPPSVDAFTELRLDLSKEIKEWAPCESEAAAGLAR